MSFWVYFGNSNVLTYDSLDVVLGQSVSLFPQPAESGSYTLTSGSLPDGLSLNPTTGEISGTPEFTSLIGGDGYGSHSLIITKGSSQSNEFFINIIGEELPLPELYVSFNANTYLPNGTLLGTGKNLYEFTINGSPTISAGNVGDSVLIDDASECFQITPCPPALRLQNDVSVAATRWGLGVPSFGRTIVGVSGDPATSELPEDNINFIMWIRDNSGGKLSGFHEYGGGSNELHFHNINAPNGEWLSLVVVRDDTSQEYTFYQEFDASSTSSYLNKATDGDDVSICIGNLNPGDINFDDEAFLDDLAVWSEALTPEQARTINYLKAAKISIGSWIRGDSLTAPSYNDQGPFDTDLAITPFLPAVDGYHVDGYVTYFEYDSLPPGLSIDPATGEISGTPDADIETGPFSTRVGVTDGLNIKVSSPFNIDIVTSIPDPIFYVGGEVLEEAIITQGAINNDEIAGTGVRRPQTLDTVGLNNSFARNVTQVAGSTAGNQALNFTGSSTSFAGFNSPPSVSWGNSEFAVMVHFKTSSALTGRRVMVGKGTNFFTGWQLMLNNNRVRFLVEDAGGDSASAESSGTFNDGQWHVAVGVRDNDTDLIYLYVDGVLEDTASISSVDSLDNNNELFLGTIYQAGTPSQFSGDYYEGDLSEVTVWTQKLTESQAKELSRIQSIDVDLGEKIKGTAPTSWSYSDQGPFDTETAITPFTPDVPPVSSNALTYFAYDLPPGLEINSATGEISGTPVGGGGTYSVRAGVTDGLNVTFSNYFNIEILAVDYYYLTEVLGGGANVYRNSDFTQETITPSENASCVVSRASANGTDWAALIESTGYTSLSAYRPWVDPTDQSFVVPLRFRNTSTDPTATISFYNSDGTLGTSFSAPNPSGSDEFRFPVWVKYDKDGNYLWHTYAYRDGGNERRLNPKITYYDDVNNLIGFTVDVGDPLTSWTSHNFVDSAGTTVSDSKITLGTNRAVTMSNIYWVNPTSGVYDKRTFGYADNIGTYWPSEGNQTGDWIGMGNNDWSVADPDTVVYYSRTYNSATDGVYDTDIPGSPRALQGVSAAIRVNNNLATGNVLDAVVPWRSGGESQPLGLSTTPNKIIFTDRELYTEVEALASEDHVLGTVPQADFASTKGAYPHGSSNDRTYVYVFDKATKTTDWARAIDIEPHTNRAITDSREDLDVMLICGTGRNITLSTGEVDEITFTPSGSSSGVRRMGFVACYQLSTGNILWAQHTQVPTSSSITRTRNALVVGNEVHVIARVDDDVTFDPGGPSEVTCFFRSETVLIRYDLSTGEYKGFIRLSSSSDNVSPDLEPTFSKRYANV